MSYNNNSPELATYEAMNVFAENIKRLRRKKDWSLEQTAAALNLSTSDYCKLESATTELNLFLICEIARLHELEPATLLLSPEAALQTEAELKEEFDYLRERCAQQELEIKDQEIDNELILSSINELKEQNKR